MVRYRSAKKYIESWRFCIIIAGVRPAIWAKSQRHRLLIDSLRVPKRANLIGHFLPPDRGLNPVGLACA
jgi:hypothetical protein